MYAVASGACDIALALGVEKLKDTGYGGLPVFDSRAGTLLSQWAPNMTAPGAFAQLASAYREKYKLGWEDLKLALAHVASAKKPCQRGEESEGAPPAPRHGGTDTGTPIVAYPLGLFDCCGVSDGAACAIVTTPEIARSMGRKDWCRVKSLQLSVSNGRGGRAIARGTFLLRDHAHSRAGGLRGVRGDKEPARGARHARGARLLLDYRVRLHGDLHISPEGGALKDVMDGLYNADGKSPCQIDGGLKCFGHPIGASGLRMIYEMYLQILGRAGERQLENPRYGLTHNLGGMPYMNICSISIVGTYD